MTSGVFAFARQTRMDALAVRAVRPFSGCLQDNMEVAKIEDKNGQRQSMHRMSRVIARLLPSLNAWAPS